MIVNIYGGTRSRIKSCIKEMFPVVYEKYIKQIALRAIDRKRVPLIRAYIDRIMSIKPFPIFDHVEIETINRCNNACSFCPVNRNYDSRPFKLMDNRLFQVIIGQLREFNYSGNIGLFSNNEPLLDDRIYEFVKIAKEALPRACLRILTNGLLLTVDKMKDLMKHIDYLAINNYGDDLRLIEPVRAVYEYCQKNRVYQDRIKIYIRKKNEILMNRAGQAKNRSKIKPLHSSCAYPFMQLVIRPDGKVSLCCNDALGGMTMGDLTKEKIIDIWNGRIFLQTRENLLNGRRYVSLCSLCDGGL